MTAPQQMPPARRRPIPGMRTAPSAAPPPQPETAAESPRTDRSSTTEAPPTTPVPTTPPPNDAPPPAASADALISDHAPIVGPDGAAVDAVRRRRPAADYAATRLVNFRIPVDLHDRFRQLVRDAEREHPRLRRPSLTELVIVLLEEGPDTPDQVAELIRRKRAGEHEPELRT